MEQSSGASGFREVDENGNPVSVEVDSAGAEERSGAAAFALNPFIGVLWLMALLLVVGGVSAFLNANLAIGPSNGAMPLPFLIFTLAPYAVLSGLIAVICLLLWHANQWERRRNQVTPKDSN